ncbi:unnamed protein product, partial [Prorocentrum cordatum]
ADTATSTTTLHSTTETSTSPHSTTATSSATSTTYSATTFSSTTDSSVSRSSSTTSSPHSYTLTSSSSATETSPTTSTGTTQTSTTTLTSTNFTAAITATNTTTLHSTTETSTTPHNATATSSATSVTDNATTLSSTTDSSLSRSSSTTSSPCSSTLTNVDSIMATTSSTTLTSTSQTSTTTITSTNVTTGGFQEVPLVFERLAEEVYDGATWKYYDRVVQDDFTISFEFKTTSSNTPNAGPWYKGMGLVDAETGGINNDFGISMMEGSVAFGIGNPDTTITSANTFADGAWHHVVASRTRSTGEFSLCVDGVLVGTKTGNTNSLTSPDQICVGRIATGNDGAAFYGSMRALEIYSYSYAVAPEYCQAFTATKTSTTTETSTTTLHSTTETSATPHSTTATSSTSTTGSSTTLSSATDSSVLTSTTQTRTTASTLTNFTDPCDDWSMSPGITTPCQHGVPYDFAGDPALSEYDYNNASWSSIYACNLNAAGSSYYIRSPAFYFVPGDYKLDVWAEDDLFVALVPQVGTVSNIFGQMSADCNSWTPSSKQQRNLNFHVADWGFYRVAMLHATDGGSIRLTDWTSVPAFTVTKTSTTTETSTTSVHSTTETSATPYSTTATSPTSTTDSVTTLSSTTDSSVSRSSSTTSLTSLRSTTETNSTTVTSTTQTSTTTITSTSFTVATYYTIAGGTCPVARTIWDTAECESAVASLGLQATWREDGKTGTWSWTPPGCWVNDHYGYFALTTTDAATNNGDYTAICREPTLAYPATVYVEYSNFCVDVNQIDLAHTPIAFETNLTRCQQSCSDDVDCSAVEWYSDGWDGAYCYHILSNTPATQGSNGTQWLDAKCYVKVLQTTTSSATATTTTTATMTIPDSALIVDGDVGVNSSLCGAYTWGPDLTTSNTDSYKMCSPIAVKAAGCRCCGGNVSSICDYDCQAYTFKECASLCEETFVGGRLCTASEILSGITGLTGCKYDVMHVWTSTACSYDSTCSSEEVNVPELDRSYSSIWHSQSPGDTYAQSMVDSPQAWSSLHNSFGDWMQMDLGMVAEVEGVVTQGRNSAFCCQWVTSFEVAVSLDGISWSAVDGNFTGNSDEDTKLYSLFQSTELARYVRIFALTSYNHVSMRAAVLTRKCRSTTETSTSSRTTTVTTSSFYTTSFATSSSSTTTSLLSTTQTSSASATSSTGSSSTTTMTSTSTASLSTATQSSSSSRTSTSETNNATSATSSTTAR